MKKTHKTNNGTSFFGSTIEATPQELFGIFGQPQFADNDGEDKVNVEWICEDDNGNVFTIYDWKYYRPLSESEKVEWHIGGFNKSVTESAAEVIREKL